MNKNYKIKNIGKTKTFIYNGIKPPKKNDVEWSIDYDNKHGVDLNVNMNNNGDKSHYHQYLTNSELEELLKIPVVDKSIHERLLEDFNPYNKNNVDLITYPRKNIQPYGEITQYPYQYPYPYPDKMDNNLMHNDIMNFNQVPAFFQRPSELTKKSRPKVIKIKIYTKKHKKHSNKNRSKSYSRSRSQTKSHTTRSSRSSRSIR
jgi:hypothetical protein